MHYPCYSASNNRFALMDQRQGSNPVDVQKICNSYTPLLDGVVLLEQSYRCDWKMRILNRNGTEAEMCGNGLRCLIQFISDLGLPDKKYRIETLGGIYEGWKENNRISISFPPPSEVRWNQTLNLGEKSCQYHHLNTGVPHAVILEKTLDEKTCSAIRHHSDFFPRGANVTLCQIQSENTISTQTYERGVEAFTGACGTGAVAAALAAAYIHRLSTPILVIPPSNEPLSVDFNNNFTNTILQGSVRKIELNFETISPKIED